MTITIILCLRVASVLALCVAANLASTTADTQSHSSTLSSGQLLSTDGCSVSERKGNLVHTRAIRQTAGSTDNVCELEARIVERVLNEERRVWTIDQRALRDIGNDLQQIVNCTEAEDTILFDVSSTIRLRKQVVVPRKLTFSSFVPATDFIDGVYPEAVQRTTLTCPQRDTGVFLIESRDVVMANLDFANCVSDTRAIVDVASCEDAEVNGKVQMHHVTFRSNRLTEAVGLNMQTPSCSAVEMVDVKFDENICSGLCGAFTSTNTTLREVQIRNNRRTNATNLRSFLFEAPPQSRVVLDGIVAEENRGAVLRLEDGTVNIIRSTFRRNAVVRKRGVDPLSACVQLVRSTAVVEDSVFEANVGESGSVFYSDQSTVTISSSIFVANRAVQGGCIYADASTKLTLTNITANGNTATVGGCVAAYGNTAVDLSESAFVNCTTNGDGGSFFVDSSRIVIDQCRFDTGQSTRGGFLFASGANVTCSGTEFLNGVAALGGSILALSESRLELRDVTFTENIASNLGGAVHMAQSSLECVDCFFASNKGQHGAGAVYMLESETEIDGGSFVNNTAQTNAGCLYAKGGNISVQNSEFRENTAEFGSALVMDTSVNATVTSSQFVDNRANFSGGDCFVEHSIVRFFDCRFLRSRSRFGGGAVYLKATESTSLQQCSFQECESARGGALQAESNSFIRISATNFLNNTALELGGAVFLLDSTTAFIRFSNFSANKATRSGGAIYIEESAVDGGNMSFLQNEARISGGAVHATVSSSMEITSSDFVENTATDGGALFLGSQTSGMFRSVRLQRNSAIGNGGSMLVRNASSVSFLDGEATENEAVSGGTVHATQSTLDIAGVTFRDGKSSSWGGYVFANANSNATLRNVSMTNGSSGDGGAAALNDSHVIAISVLIADCFAERDGGGIFINGTSTLLSADSIFENNHAIQRGGALSILAYRPLNLTVQFHRCVLRNNQADCGGAMNYVGRNPLRGCEKPGAICTFVAFSETILADNHATLAGGAILTTDVRSLRFDCGSTNIRSRETFYSRPEWEAMSVIDQSLDVLCPTWTNNTAEVYGPTIASYARAMQKTIRYRNGNKLITTDKFVRFANQSSGEPLPDIDLELVDEFGQGTAVLSNNGSVTAELSSPGEKPFIEGSVSLFLSGRKGSFMDITGIQPPGVYLLRIDFNLNEHMFPSFEMEVEIRNCSLGEESRSNLCVVCNTASFNLNPNKASCQPCPEYGDCVSRLIHPSKGHWHQSPCSKRVQRCLTAKSCDFEDRRHQLSQMSDSIQSCVFDMGFVAEYEKAQCKEGHTGPLCGSCLSDFGRSQTACEKCLNGFSSTLLVILSFVILLGLATFTIRSNLVTFNQFAKKMRQAQSRRLQPQQQRLPIVNESMVEMMYTGQVPQAARTSTPGRIQGPEQLGKRAELARWKTVELFKITINFLQVTAVAISINVDWTTLLRTLFDAADVVGGATSDATSASLECLMSDEAAVARAVKVTIVEFFMPLSVIFILALFWWFAKTRHGRDYTYLAKRFFLSANAVFYISYISITRTLVNILNCIQVYDSVDMDDPDSTAYYWAMDTQLECYVDSHAALAGFIGWPFLALFTIGFPLMLACTIVTNVKSDLADGWIYDAAGFMYRSYRRDFVYWESIIMLRKAALATVVVFAYRLGSVLQGVAAVFVLALALYFHTVSRPFRKEFDLLNELEGMSLLVSLITFVAALLFDDERVSEGVRIAITIILATCNIGIFLLFVSLFLVFGSKYLEMILDREGIPHNPEGSAIHILRVYFIDFLFGKVRRGFDRLASKNSVQSRTINNTTIPAVP